MDRIFKKKSKRSQKSLQQHLSLGIPTNVAAGPLGFRADLDIGHKGEGDTRASRIIFHAKESLDQVPPAPGESSIPDTATVGGNQHDGPSKDYTGNTRKEEGELTKLATVPERDNEDAAHGAVTTLLDVTQEPTSVAEEPTDGFGPLKGALETICSTYANHEGTTTIVNMIGNLLSSIATLGVLFATHPGNVAEQRCRSELICTFEGIERQLRTLSKRPGQQQPEDFQDDDEVSELLEDLREAINDYDMAQRKHANNEAQNLISPTEAAILNGIRSAYAAEHRHGDRKGCLKGTRRAVLNKIELWTGDFHQPPVYWLNGLAGTGKTTIAQTIAGRLFADGRLGASFFCSRDFSDRRDLHFIFPTLAVQLARKYTEFRSIFVPLVQSDPGIVCESLYNQMKTLLVRPLRKSEISTVIVIDALDECKDEEPASAILSVLGQFISKIPKVKFFLTGRPEPQVLEGFRLPLLAEVTDVFVLHNVEPNLINADIRVFLKHSFLELAQHRPGLTGWPTKEQVDLLCERAAGLFIYAVATIKFVSHRNNNPKKQLDRLLQLPESSTREGRTELKADITLDSLYMSILQDAYGHDDPEDDPKLRLVLSAVILAENPLSPSTIATLLGFDTEDVFPLLLSIHSLLILQEDVDRPVRPFHKSFPDFIVDPARCTNQRFHISPPDHHPQLLVSCLDLMNGRLKKNICKLPDATVNSDVSNLEERIRQYIDPGLQYACKSWHTHLINAHKISAHVLAITPALHHFLETNFLFWLEILSVLGAARNAADALQVVSDWLKESPMLNLANDCSHFVNGYFEIINTSSPHIYHSALVLAPKASAIWKLYELHAHPFVRVVHGALVSWDMNIAATMLPSAIRKVVWSPCSRFIAVDTWDDTLLVNILDPVTLQRLQSLKGPPGTHAWPTALSFSPDSHVLTCSGDGGSSPEWEHSVVVWDLQSGGVIVSATKEPGLSAQSPSMGNESSITYSRDGKMVGVCSWNFDHIEIISIYDLASGIHIHTHSLGTLSGNGSLWENGTVLEYIWTHRESLRFATATLTTITIWEVGFASGTVATEVETISLPDNTFAIMPTHADNIQHRKQVRLLPALSQLAIANEGNFMVWDTQNSKPLLHCTDIQCPPSISFSSDGRVLAYLTAGSEIYLWKESPTGYIIQGALTSSEYPRLLLSPNGESIIIVEDRLIRLWWTKCFTTTPSAILTQGPQNTRNFVIDFSPDGTLAAFARLEDDTVTVLDLKSGVPRLTISTSLKVYGLKVTGSAVIVVGLEKIITWNILSRDCAPDTKIGIKDSTQEVNLSSRGDSASAASISPDLCCVAIIMDHKSGFLLEVYSASTGRFLGGADPADSEHMGIVADTPWFTPDGCGIWLAVPSGESDVWTITSSRGPDPITLECEAFRVDPLHPPDGYPWGSSCGYQVTNDGWVLGPDGKHLLMLPPPWQSDVVRRVWNGRFLALLHGGLPEPVILELEP